MSHYAVKLVRRPPLTLPLHNDAVDIDGFARWCAERSAEGALLALDLFAGGGGLSLGLKAAGWTVAASVDHDARSVETHAHNFGGLSLDLDLSDVTQRDALIGMFDDIDVDLIAGGPPCQPFSRAGMNKIRSLVAAGTRPADDARKDLWRAYLDVVLALKPRAVFMENVPDMALGDDLAVLRIIVDTLETAGYDCSARIADTWRYGVPQHRRRLVLLARRDNEPIDWPADFTKSTVRDAIGDLPRLPDGSTGDAETPYGSRPRAGTLARLLRDGAPSGLVHDHVTRPVRADDRKAFELMTSKTLYADLPAELRRYDETKFKDKYKRLDWDELSRTITAHIAKDGYWYIHPDQHRTLTVREAARLQTFPDRFRFAGSRSDAFRQIGNAVPPLFAERVATALRTTSDVPDTDDSRRSCTPEAARANGKSHGSSGRDDSPTRGSVARADRLAIANALAGHAHQVRDTSSWYRAPGDSVTLPVAAAVAVTSRVGLSEDEIANVVNQLRGLSTISKSTLNRLVKAVPHDRARAALERLRPLAGRTAGSLTPDDAAALLNLNRSEVAKFGMLLGVNVLPRSQRAARVAARVLGSTSDRVNTNTDGRMDLGRLIGAGPDAALRAAAVMDIGKRFCRPQESNCADCPLRDVCISSATLPACVYSDALP